MIHVVQKRWHCRQPRRHRRQPFLRLSKIAYHQRHCSKNCFAGPQCRISALKMFAVQFQQTHPDVGQRQHAVQQKRISRQCAIIAMSRGNPASSATRNSSSSACIRVTPACDQSGNCVSCACTPVNVAFTGCDARYCCKNASSALRSGTAVADAQRDAPSIGIVIHLRSRNERSTALINSCTCAPSSKFPSFASSSERISVMNDRTRLA